MYIYDVYTVFITSSRVRFIHFIFFYFILKKKILSLQWCVHVNFLNIIIIDLHICNEFWNAYNALMGVLSEKKLLL